MEELPQSGNNTWRGLGVVALVCARLSFPAGMTSWALYDIPGDWGKWATPRSSITSAMNKSLLAKSYPSLCVVSGNDDEINIYLKCVLAPSLTQVIKVVQEGPFFHGSAAFHKRRPVRLSCLPSLLTFISSALKMAAPCRKLSLSWPVKVHLSDGRCSLGSHSVPDRSVEEDAGLHGNALHLSPGVPALTCGPELQALTERMRSGTRADNAGILRRCSASERVGGGQTNGTGLSRWFQRLSWASPVRRLPPPGDFLGTHRYRIHWRDYIYISSPGGTWVSSRKSWTVSPMWEQDVQRCLGELIPERWRKSEMETWISCSHVSNILGLTHTLITEITERTGNGLVSSMLACLLVVESRRWRRDCVIYLHQLNPLISLAPHRTGDLHPHRMRTWGNPNPEKKQPLRQLRERQCDWKAIILPVKEANGKYPPLPLPLTPWSRRGRRGPPLCGNSAPVGVWEGVSLTCKQHSSRRSAYWQSWLPSEATATRENASGGL